MLRKDFHVEAIAAILALGVLIVIGVAITMASSYAEKLNKLTRVVSSLSSLTEGRLDQIVHRIETLEKAVFNIEPAQNQSPTPDRPKRGTSDLD